MRLGYAAAAYIIVLAAMGFYWWTLSARFAQLRREMPTAPQREGEAAKAPPGPAPEERMG